MNHSMNHSIIVYRKPLEQMLWEGTLPVFVPILSGALTFFVLMYLGVFVLDRIGVPAYSRQFSILSKNPAGCIRGCCLWGSRLLASLKGNEMALKRVVIFSGDEDCYDWPPRAAKEFTNWLLENLSQIPSQHQDSAEVLITGVSDDWERNCANIRIYYDRPETPEEESSRHAQQLMRHERIKAEELETLRRLKEKYGE